MIIIAIMIIMMRMILIMIIIIMMILIIMNRPAGPDSAPATRHGPARSPDEAIYIYIYIYTYERSQLSYIKTSDNE